MGRGTAREPTGPEVLRRDATTSPLHGLVREHLETFLARFQDEHGGRRLPRYVEQELRGFLACGDPAHGFCRIHCPHCSADLLVPFSCKGRAFCPSCGGRRMAEVAANLIERVLPPVPVRQWVLSVPWALRLRMACDPRLCRAVARAFLRAVSASYRRSAKEQGLLEFGPDPEGPCAEPPCPEAPCAEALRADPLRAPRAHAGAVNFVQRFGSSLALNVHFHALFLDGAHVVRGPASRPRFHPAPPLTPDELHRVQRDIVRRIERVLRRRGILQDDPASDAGAPEDSDSLLPFVQAASLQSKVALGLDSGRPIPRLIDPAACLGPSSPSNASAPHPDELRCEQAGFSLHAATRIEADDRDRLERLVRYVARPALAQGRLEVRGDGRVKWSLRRPWRDGTRAFVFDPLTFLERLVALVPHPREHQWTYFGVLAPASPLRDAVVPRRTVPSPVPSPGLRPAPGIGEAEPEADPCAKAQRRSWAELLQRTFAVDVLRCPTCGGRRHRVATLTDPLVARRILKHLRLRAEPPPLAPARPEPQLRFA